MQDRFRFRAWDKRSKKYEDNIQNCVEAFNTITLKSACTKCFNDFLENENIFEIEQCTGLKDKNGKLIYEGDIIRGVWEKVKVEYVVKWDEYGAQFVLEVLNDDGSADFNILGLEHLEIIGNIHENPELLEEYQMKNIYLTKKEIQVIIDALDEYIFEHNLDELPTYENGEYYGYSELEKHSAKEMNNIQNIYSKILRRNGDGE